MKKTALIGGGGHAGSVIAAGAIADGYVDRECRSLPVRWLGDDRCFASNCPAAEWRVHIAIVGTGIGSMAARRQIIEAYGSYGHATIVAASAIVTSGSVIGDGCAVMHGAVVNDATVGADSVVNTGAVIEHGCKLGSNVFVGPGAVVCGGVSIGDDCFVGAGSTVINCVKICAGAFIGAGAVVTADIVEPGVYLGVPATKRIK